MIPVGSLADWSARVRCLRWCSNKKKSPSDSPLFDLSAMDVFQSEEKLCHLARYIELPPLPASAVAPTSPAAASSPAASAAAAGGALSPSAEPRSLDGIPLWFIVNFQLPAYEPPIRFGGLSKRCCSPPLAPRHMCLHACLPALHCLLSPPG